jgi:hypothetical protein
MRIASLVSILLVSGCGGPTTKINTSGVEVRGEVMVDQTVSGDTRDADDDYQPACGTTGGGGDEHWTFIPPSDGVYRFNVQADFDSVLALRTPDSEVGCNDDADTSKRESELVLSLTRGQTYDVVIDGYQGSGGTYLLRVTQESGGGGGDDPGPVPPDRQGVLTLAQAVDGNTAGGSDHHTPSCGSESGSADHVWHFVAPAAGSYTFDSTSQYDATLAIIDEQGREIACNDDNGNTSASQIVVDLGAGPYGVVVDGYGGATGTYRLTASRTGSAPPPPPPPTQGGGTITVGQTVNGNTTNRSDQFTPSCGSTAGSGDDVWSFTTPAAAGVYQIHVSAQYDSTVAVFDDRGVELACNDDQGQASESEVVVGLASNRTYRIVVDGYSGATGSYRLSVQNQAAPPPPPPGPQPPPTNPQTSGTLRLNRAVTNTTAGGTDQYTPTCGAAMGSPDDVWAFTAPSRGLYRIHADTQFDAVLAVYDANARQIDCNDDHQSTAQSRIEARLQPRNRYFVVVDGYSGASGTYTLRVTRPRRKPPRRP